MRRASLGPAVQEPQLGVAEPGGDNGSFLLLLTWRLKGV